jgi:predicted CoA-binding protein
MSAFADDEAIRKLLATSKVIAVVGLSSKRYRPSYSVSQYMKSAGYQILPVNPNESAVIGEKAFASLDEIPKNIRVDIVDIFRRSEEVPEVVGGAIRIGAHAVWMQEGVVHKEAAARASAAGLLVVMDRCILKDHQRLLR